MDTMMNKNAIQLHDPSEWEKLGKPEYYELDARKIVGPYKKEAPDWPWFPSEQLTFIQPESTWTPKEIRQAEMDAEKTLIE